MLNGENGISKTRSVEQLTVNSLSFEKIDSDHSRAPFCRVDVPTRDSQASVLVLSLFFVASLMEEKTL